MSENGANPTEKLSESGMTTREKSLLAGIALATVAAGSINYGVGAGVPSFLVATVALAGLAWLVSFATEQLGESFGPAVTGLMQSTLGNLPEFFVVLFALKAGQVVVAQTSIVGSIFANGLLVLGLAIIVGARREKDGLMKFSKRLPEDTATLLLIATVIIVVLGISGATSDAASDSLGAVSVIAAVAMLCVYGAWVMRYIKTNAAGDPAHREAPRVSVKASAAMLAVAAVGAAFVSEWFVHGLEPAIEAFHISEAFAGLVIVAIAGNAIENAVGVIMAAKGESDLAISVIKNSVAQIAAFLFPLLILCSLFFETTMTFALEPVWIGGLALLTITIWQITRDGVAAAWEGVALVAFFVVLAGIALFE